MTLPAPRLDDRSFQDLVDEAKSRIHRYSPDWTDHNVSDPGVALIELFAWMTEMILYRLNQVPDRLYLKFLELMGIQLHGSVAASTDLLFRLAGPRTEVVRILAGTQVATERRDEEPIVFETRTELLIMPPKLVSCLTRTGDQFADHTQEVLSGIASLTCFPTVTPGDAVYFGFEDPLAANLLRFTVVTGTEGAGVDPSRPPLQWSAWDGHEWVRAEVLEDTTFGLNSVEGGDVVVLLGPEHVDVAVGPARAYWVRCMLVEPEGDAPAYVRSPVIHSLEVASIGGAARAIHAETAGREFLGVSNGEPNQSFQVSRPPVLRRVWEETVAVQLPGADDEQRWQEVPHFGEAGPQDQVFTWDSASGEIRFGPQIRLRNGLVRQYGAVPPADAKVFVTGYRHGGGRKGNVAAGQLRVLRTSIPFVGSVTNLRHATSGVDPESIEDAKVRGPLSLRTGDRAVTADDFERLAHEATGAVGRAHCIPDTADPSVVQVLVVPRTDEPARSLELEHLKLPDDLLDELRGYLDERRLLTCRVRILEPRYVGVMVVAQVTAAPGMRPETVREAATEAIYDFLHPLTGGLDGRGRQFGQALGDGEIQAVLRGVPGLASVNKVFFLEVNPRSGEVDQRQKQRIALPPDALPLSYRHQVVVATDAPGGTS